MALLQRVLLGCSQKSVALESGYALSTTASKLAQCLASIGITCKLSRVPAILVQLLHAVHRREPDRSTPVELYDDPDGTSRIESDRPELALAGILSQAEIHVVALIAEGSTYAEIARQRRASARTIANQLSSVYRKLRISGRLELLCFLARRAPLSRPRAA
jgi:DNA-binding CsgD family transcriptional regulator